MKYIIPKIWEREPCYIIGGGWSLKGFDVSLFEGKNIIGVNNSFKLADFIQFCWFKDYRWYGWKENQNSIAHRHSNSSFPISFVSCHPRFQNHPYIYYVQARGGCGINKISGQVCGNYCSGLSAINFAYHLGSNPIILLGFDMKPNPDDPLDNNYHREHEIKPRKIFDPYLSFLRAVEPIRKDADSLGVTILNVTVDSGIPDNIFKWISIKEAINL